MKYEQQPFRPRHTGDLFVMLGDDLTWVASMPLTSRLALGVISRVANIPPLGEPATAILASYHSAPLSGTITEQHLRRQTRREGLVTIEGVRVQSTFARFASVLAQAHGDVALLVGLHRFALRQTTGRETCIDCFAEDHEQQEAREDAGPRRDVPPRAVSGDPHGDCDGTRGVLPTARDAALIDALAANVELRAKLVRLMAEWHQEAEEYEAKCGGTSAPSYASGLISAWDDLRDALGVAV
jgi:hypothetical protein